MVAGLEPLSTSIKPYLPTHKQSSQIGIRVSTVSNYLFYVGAAFPPGIRGV